jgi:hypothetical protein
MHDSLLRLQRSGARRDLTCRAYQMRASTADTTARTVEAILATEAPVTVFDMRSWSLVREILVIQGRTFPAQVPLLDTHQRDSVEQQLGSTRSIRVEGADLVGVRHFSSVQESADAFTKVAEGHLTDGSIGYTVTAYRDLKPGETLDLNGRTFRNDGQDALRISYEWALMEDSVCPIGADAGAKMRDAAPLSLPLPTTTPPATTGERNAMDFVSWLQARGLDAAKLTPEQTAAFTADYERSKAAPVTPTKPAAPSADEMAERAARAELHLDMLDLARSHGIELTRADLAKVAKREAGLDLILARKADAEKSQPAPIAGRVTIGADAEDKKRAAAEDGLLHALGYVAADAKNLGMRKGSPLEIVRHYTGAFDAGRDDLAKIGCRYDLAHVQVRGANQSAANFSNVLANVFDKIALAGYNGIQSTHQLWTRERLVSDFKTFTDAAVINGLLGEQTAKGVPADEMNLGEKSVTGALAIFHRRLTFTYQDWRNDDLGEFARLLSDASGIAKKTEDREAYKALLGATWTSNTTATAAVWDDTNQRFIFNKLDAVLAAIQDRTVAANGENVPLYAVPNVILAPNARATQLEVVAGIKPANGVPVASPRGLSLNVISSPWLSNSSLTGYSADDYFAIDTRLSPVVFVRDRFAMTPTVTEKDAGMTPDRAWYIQHNVKAVLGTLDGSQKGDWA